jgi:hypothetical protein
VIDADAGVVDEQVDRPEIRRDRGEEIADRLAIAEIAGVGTSTGIVFAAARTQIATFAPRAARSIATSRPMPLDAPVTSAMLPRIRTTVRCLREASRGVKQPSRREPSPGRVGSRVDVDDDFARNGGGSP